MDLNIYIFDFKFQMAAVSSQSIPSDSHTPMALSKELLLADVNKTKFEMASNMTSKKPTDTTKVKSAFIKDLIKTDFKVAAAKQLKTRLNINLETIKTMKLKMKNDDGLKKAIKDTENQITLVDTIFNFIKFDN
ncbi:unnamed protein product [Adineta steineri]|uniref:Uncharacterized protein n=2 Tax=Adineta steineri TaxID=433720 RepID=A0A819S3V3_9BILA|nr:unnamed protein product [Adineta steineri]